jgi:hypothetical protein
VTAEVGKSLEKTKRIAAWHSVSSGRRLRLPVSSATAAGRIVRFWEVNKLVRWFSGFTSGRARASKLTIDPMASGFIAINPTPLAMAAGRNSL